MTPPSKPSYFKWQCPNGHVYDSPVRVTAVKCGQCKVSKPVWMAPVLEASSS